MRTTIDQQMVFGQIDISQIKFNLKSRHETQEILRGLQAIYTNEETRKEVFKILEKAVLPNIDKTNGRPGMSLWKILVMATLRLNLHIDYDHLHDLVNYHFKIREMLGHGYFERDLYCCQTIRDNVSLLTPEILNKINEVVVKFAHKVLKKKPVN
jgi:transposase, IS5 family